MTTFEELRIMIEGIQFGIQGLGIGQFLREGAGLPSVTQDLSAIKTSRACTIRGFSTRGLIKKQPILTFEHESLARLATSPAGFI